MVNYDGCNVKRAWENQEMAETLREMVKRAIAEKRISQAEAARRADMTKQQLSLYLRGESDMLGENIETLLKRLDKGLATYNLKK